MAQNEIPRSYDPIVILLEDAADGAQAHGPVILLAQNTETKLRLDLTNLAGKAAGPMNVPPAVPGTKALWNAAKTDKVAKSAAFRSAKSTGKALAAACISVLKPRLGHSWSNAWQAAGFTNGSLAVPANPMTMLQQFRTYFLANPTHEKPDLAVGIHATAAATEVVAQNISTASTASNQSNTAAGTAKRNLENAITAGRKRLTGLREELHQLMGDDDDRWYAFGFEKPSDPETPEVPENLTGVPGGGGGALFVDFDDARRADNYRISIFNNASNVKLDEKIMDDSEAMFTGLPTAVLLRIEVTARTTESLESQPVTLTLTL